MRPMSRSTLASLAALTLTAAAVGAQECRLDETVEWWPHREQLGAPKTGAERSAMDANMAAVEALVRKTVSTAVLEDSRSGRSGAMAVAR